MIFVCQITEELLVTYTHHLILIEREFECAHNGEDKNMSFYLMETPVWTHCIRTRKCKNCKIKNMYEVPCKN